MTTYVIKQLRIQVAQNQNGENLIFKRGDQETQFEAVAALEEGGLKKMVISIPTVDLDVMAMMQITAGRLLYIETDTELTVKLDDVADTGVLVTPVVTASASTKPAMLYMEGDFTHVYISIAGTSGSANVVVGIVGA